MTRTNSTLILKTTYFYSNEDNELHLDLVECDSVTELTEMHVYERVAKRSEYTANDKAVEKHYNNVDDILTTIIITDFDLREAESDDIDTKSNYKQDFYFDVNCNCFNLDYDTISYRIKQLS